MKNLITATIFYLAMTGSLLAQATGNVIYNSNNRFFQNNTYRASSSGVKYMSNSPTVSYDAYGNQQFTTANSNEFQFSNFNVSNNEVTMNINVLFNAKPTGYMAIFHMNQSGKKISELDTQVSHKVAKFKAMALSIGITSDNFYTDMIALVPIFEQGRRSTKPKGFELQKNLHIKYTNASDLDKLFSMAAQCEIYDLIKVEYLYDNAEKAGKDMHAKALQLLQDKIAYYKNIGVKVDTAYRYIHESGNVFFPVDKYTSYQPLAVNSIDEEDKPADDKGELMKTKQGLIQRTTVFYNPTDCSGYDAVLNPNPLEPPIQFTYTLQVKYRMTQPVTKVIDKSVEKQHEIMIITPNGEVKTIMK